MSWDADIFIEHNMKFSNAAELISAFENRTGKKVFVEVFNDDKSKEIKCPVDYNGWLTYHWDFETLEGNFQEQGLIEFYDKSTKEEPWVTRSTVMVYTPNVDLHYDWYNLVCKLAELAAMPLSERQTHPFQCIRLNIYKLVKQFGGTKSLLFCGDANQDIEEQLWQGSTIDEVLKNHSEKINLIKYQELEKFSYNDNISSPENSFVYSQTFILDDFEDLKPMHNSDK